MGKGKTLQQRVLEPFDVRMSDNEEEEEEKEEEEEEDRKEEKHGSTPHTKYKNQIKVDHRPQI